MTKLKTEDGEDVNTYEGPSEQFVSRDRDGVQDDMEDDDA